MLIEIFGPNQDEMTKDGRKSYNKKLHNFYSRNIFLIIKLGRMKWIEHVACKRKKRHTY